MPHVRFLPALSLLFVCATAALPQVRSGGRGRVPPPARAVPRPVPSPEDQYWAAQRSIASAVQQLEAYLRANPDGERAATAKQQLEELRALSAAASLPEWSAMEPGAYGRSPQWRITSVERLPDATKVNLEIRCTRSDGGECYFSPFDRSPLVLVDQRGRFYPMVDAGALPRDVPVTGRERAEVTPGQAVLTGGRSISVTVGFAPLENRVVSVQAYYRDENRAEPARFPLSVRR